MPSESDPGEPLGVSVRTSVRTIVLSAIGAVTAIVYFVTQGFIEAVASRATGTNVSVRGPEPSFPILGLLFGLLLVRSAYDVLSWLARRYTIGQRELTIDEGILTRHHRVAPYTRVQQVDVRRPLLAQLLDIAEVRIETAGEAGTTTMRLRMLRRSDAEQLRQFILGQRAALQRPDAMPTGPAATYAARRSEPSSASTRSLLQLTPEQLLLAAVTHSTVVIGVPAAIVVGVWIASFRVLASGRANVGTWLALTVLGGALLVVHIVRSVVVHWNYSLEVADDDVHLRFGLFDVRQLTIPRRRVQQVTIVDNPARRALGVVSLTMHSAAGPGGGDRDGATRFEVPLLDRRDIDGFLSSMMGSEAWRPPTFEKRPPRAQRRAVVRRIVLLALLAIVPAIALFPLGLVALAVCALGVPWGLAAHARAGHGRSTTLVAFSRGVVHHLIELVPVGRIQSCRIRTSPLQRLAVRQNRQLATLHVDIAGDRNSPRLYDMRGATAEALMVALPRQVERSNTPG